MMTDAPTRAGFVAVLGAPNVGKSTLTNCLVGAKVSIVSPKVQTTRSKVLGIYIAGPAQVVLVDTPGIFEPRRRLDRAMVAAAWGGAGDADLVLLVVDAIAGLDAKTRAIVDRLAESERRVHVIINKVDAVPKPKLLALASEIGGLAITDDIFMVSALTGDGVEDLKAFLAERMPEGPWLYPEDEISDMPARLLAAEITREKLYLHLHKELPYQAAVETESWEQAAGGGAKVRQVIYVARKSQKGIVLGKQGSRVKVIGTEARAELEELLEMPIHLFIHVKVREKWQDDPERYRDLGLDFDAK